MDEKRTVRTKKRPNAPERGRHHWWPNSLSANWAREDGRVSQLLASGHVADAKPYGFGFEENSHLAKLSTEYSIWDESIEHMFDQSDGRFPFLIPTLLGLDTPPLNGDETIGDRLTAHNSSDQLLSDLATCLASLIVRSPSFRHRVRIGTESLQRRFAAKPNVSTGLVALKIKHSQEIFERQLNEKWKFIILMSDHTEFAFGDGFFHNFDEPERPPRNPKFLIPLLPTVAVIYDSRERMSGHSRIFTARMRSDEVDMINEVTSIYSRNFLYYRLIGPRTGSQLLKGVFQQVPNHEDPLIEAIAEAARQSSS